MIESPKNFIEQFQNFIEHIAGVMKTFLTKEVADDYYLSKTGTATRATRDAEGNVITSTYATKTEVTSGLSEKLGKTEKASSASTADAVAWTGISDKPNFATVATSGSYDDLKNKPSIPNSTVSEVFNSKTSGNTITITGLTPYKPCFLLLSNFGSGSKTIKFNLTSGAVINGSGGDSTNTATIETSVYGSAKAVGTAVIVPIGTTLSFAGGNVGSIQVQFVAYQ